MKINYSYCNTEAYVRNKIILNGMLKNNLKVLDSSSPIKFNPLRQLHRLIKILLTKSKTDIIFGVLSLNFFMWALKSVSGHSRSAMSCRNSISMKRMPLPIIWPLLFFLEPPVLSARL